MATSLETPEKLRILQRKLYCKAKAEPTFRFYLLYDKICRADTLYHAYRQARANAGAPGVDGVTFAQIEAEGMDAWLASLREELVSRTYRPAPVRRVMIPKPGGGERPLGIPTIRDRVAQTAAKLVLEPIFEADFEDGAYGYRPGRSAAKAYCVVPGSPKCGIQPRLSPASGLRRDTLWQGGDHSPNSKRNFPTRRAARHSCLNVAGQMASCVRLVVAIAPPR